MSIAKEKDHLCHYTRTATVKTLLKNAVSSGKGLNMTLNSDKVPSIERISSIS